MQAMSIQERREHLVQLIYQVQDEELITLLEEDLMHYQQGTTQVDENLSPEDLAELRELMEEPAGQDTISFEAFKAEMAKWRKHSL